MRFSGILAQRRAVDGVQRALVGAAVFLEPALQQDRQRRLAARGRPEQQQQPAADIGAGGGGLEVVDDARQRLVDAEQLALEQLARAHALGGVRLAGAAVPAQHVPDVFVAACAPAPPDWRAGCWREIAEGAFPALRAVQAAEGAQGLDEVGSAAVGIVLNAERSHRPSLRRAHGVTRDATGCRRRQLLLNLVPTLRTMSDGLQILTHLLR